MSIFQTIAIPLFLIAALEISLGIILVRNNSRRSRVQKAVTALSFFSAAFSFITATMYLRAGLGLSIGFTAKLNWIGWFTVPAALQILYYLKDERGRSGNLVGAILYPPWVGILGLCLFTNTIVQPNYSVIPFINHPGPLEIPARLFGSGLAVWLLVETVRVRRRLHGLKKAQLNYFFQGVLIFGGGAAFTAGFLQVFGGFGFEPGLASFFSFPWVVLTYYAISRYRLFDIRLLVSRVLSIILLVGVFSVTQIWLIRFLVPALGENLSILISLGVIGFIFSLTRINRRMQRIVQQMVMQDKYEYHAILKKSITAMVTILKLDALLEYILASMTNSLGVEKASLVLKDRSGGPARMYGHAVAWEDGLSGSSALQALLQSGRGVVREELLENASTDSYAAFEVMDRIGAQLILPLMYKGEIKGYMVLGEKGNRDPYFQSDIDLLESLAAQAAVAIENAQLYEEARHARGSMRESEAKFQTLAETAEVAIFIHQGGNFLYANRAAEAIGGYTVDEYLSMDFMSLVHPDFIDLVRTRASERLARAGMVPPQYEFKIVRKNGEERWALMTAGISEFEGKPAVIGTLVDITARKQAEQEREQMSLLVENSSDFIGMATMEGTIIFVNGAGRRLVGLPAGRDVKQMSLLDFFLPEDLPQLAAELLPRDAWRGEFRLKHFTTGQPIPVDMYGFTVFNQKSGQPMARATVIRDISDLKRAREEREEYFRQLQQVTHSMQESEAKFRSLAETAPAAIFIHQGGKFLYANAPSCAMLGYTRDELLSMDFWGVTYPEDKEMVVQRGRGRLAGDTSPIRYELRVVTKSGEIRWVDMNIGMTVYEGKPAVIGTAIDISDRKMAENERERYYRQLQETTQSLRESEEKFRTLAETTTAAILIHQGQKLVYANPAGAIITGYTSDELLQEDFWSLIHPDYQEVVRERGMSRIAGDRRKDYEYKFVKKNGEECWVSMTAGFIEYAGKPAIIATLFDITDWKRAEEAKVKFYEESVRQYQERIEEEKRHRIEKEKILMDLHDGIGGITTNISILSELARKARDHESALKLLSTISGLSREGIAEIRGFMHSLDAKELNWRTLASELRSQGTNMIQTHSIAFSIQTEVRDIGEQPGSLTWVNIFKIYKEALTNVVKHSRATEVSVLFRVDQDGMHLLIRDNGVGVSNVASGGRGLSNMRTRAEDIGGAVTVLNGKGTSIKLQLPLPLKYPAGGMVNR